MSDPYETTEQHLDRLLRRALNSFDLPDSTVDLLGSALAHSSSLYSSHHSPVLHRETYRHTFLLADGSDLALWELVHSGGRDEQESRRHELYADEGDAHIAAARLAGSLSDAPAFGDEAGRGDMETLTVLMSAPRPRHPGRTPPTTPPTTPAGSCAARRTGTGRARRRPGCSGPPSPTTSPRSSGASAKSTARRPGSRSTSTRSCCWTAARRACGRSSTRRPPTAVTCARCTRTRRPPARRWRAAPESADPGRTPDRTGPTEGPPPPGSRCRAAPPPDSPDHRAAHHGTRPATDRHPPSPSRPTALRLRPSVPAPS